MDLLVFTPVLRLCEETLESIVALKWAGGRIDRLLGEDLVTPPGARNHRKQYEHAFRLAREHYDLMLVVESDIVVPKDAALLLASDEADIALGLYAWRSGTGCNLLLRNSQGGMGAYASEAKVLSQVWGKVVPAWGIGLGCTMFRKRAMEIPLRECDQTYCDWAYMEDANSAGLRIVCDTRVVCGHVFRNEILYPIASGEVLRMPRTKRELRDVPDKVRVRMLVSVASPFGCPTIGEEMEIPLSDALSWYNAGYCEILTPLGRESNGRARRPESGTGD